MAMRRKLNRAQLKTLNATEHPPDEVLKCKCGKRILCWNAERRIMHEAPECQEFTKILEGTKGHRLEGPVTVINAPKANS